MKKLISASAVLTALAITPTSAAELRTADGFPNKPITVYVPHGAGGGSDTMVRNWARSFGRVLGQKVEIINKPGKAGIKAAPEYMKLPHDGHALFQGLDVLVAHHAAGRFDINPAVDWQPVCTTNITFNQLYIRTDDDRFTDWESFLAYVKENPGEIKIADSGHKGAMDMLSISQLEEKLGIELESLSNEPSQRYESLVDESADVMIEQPGDVSGFMDTDQIKPILTFFDDRPKDFADVPTHKEVGADFQPLLRFRGFWVHKDTPDDRKALLTKACKKAFDSVAFQSFNKSKFMHLINSYRDADQFKKMIEETITTYKKLFAKDAS